MSEVKDLLPYLADARVVVRFWSKVDFAPPSECWLWNGPKYPSGYGKFLAARGKGITASRFALSLWRGEALGADELACHRCDNPGCVNPLHLFAGSQVDNLADMLAKERGNFQVMYGEANGSARLKADDVREIRRLAETETQASLARRFGVAPCHISAIVRRQKWKHLDDIPNNQGAGGANNPSGVIQTPGTVSGDTGAA